MMALVTISSVSATDLNKTNEIITGNNDLDTLSQSDYTISKSSTVELSEDESCKSIDMETINENLTTNGNHEMLSDSAVIAVNENINDLPSADNTNDNTSYVYPTSLINSSFSDLKNIPSSYDSRNYGYITPVKDQGNTSDSWIYASIATLEACIKKITNINYDFSEEIAKNTLSKYYSTDIHYGGYDSWIMAYLTSWLGPINEKNNEHDDSSAADLYPHFFIQNIYFLPGRENPSDNDLIKKAIMDYGAVTVTINFDNNALMPISLVGWDNSYNKDDSLGRPAKGAWIFKCSWGTEWGDKGFGYLSYDAPLSSELYAHLHAYTFIFNENDSYIYNHQYEPAGVSDYLIYDGNIFYENKFICNETSQDLAAFATYFKYPTNYTVSVYKNNNLILTQNGYSNAGYYTIPFNEIITLQKDDEFVIMIENRNDGENLFPICQAEELNETTFGSNTSFVSYDGKNWIDLYNLDGSAEFLYGGIKTNTSQVACIKAFTTMKNALTNVSIEVNNFNSLDINEKTTIKITVKDNEILKRIEGSLFNLNINGKDYYLVIHDGKASLDIKFDKIGSYTLTAKYKNNIFESNTVKFNFKVNKITTVLTAKSISKVYGTNGKSLITLKDKKGNPIANAIVLFNINGKTTKLKTNSKGQTNMAINLAPKNYKATVTYNRNDKYTGAKTTAKIVVKKATPKLIAKKATFKLKAKTKKYTATLKNNKNQAMKNTKITLTIKNKKYTAKTNKKGVATFKLKINKKGTNKATITYVGNTYYNKATKKVTITVKK